MKNSVAIFGGTFNPIHNAHIVIAEAALEQYDLGSVMFLPNAVPPHKECPDLADNEIRMEMVKSAISYNDNFFVSDYEMKNGGLSYTVDTLRHFKNIYDEIYFIIGGDSVRDFPKWYCPNEIATLCTLLVFPREGLDLKKHMDNVRDLFGAKVYEISSPQIDISSSDIRRCIKIGEDVSDFLPSGVWNIIKENKLYEK